MTEPQKKAGLIAGAIVGAMLLLGDKSKPKAPDCPDGKCPVPSLPAKPVKPKPGPGPYVPPQPDDPFSPNQPKP